MILTIKNNFMSAAGSSTVYTDTGVEFYKVKGSFLSPRKTKKLLDFRGRKCYIIKNKLFTLFNKVTVIYDSRGKYFGKIKRLNISAANRYKVEGFGCNLNINGGFFDLKNPIIRNGVQVGVIERKVVSLTDTFILDVDDIENLSLYVAIVIAIDNIRDSRKLIKR